MNPQIFIISWTGQHENAAHIARELLDLTSNISIVYSDTDPELEIDVPCRLIKRPNELYWGDKFKACLDACGDDPMLVIHADCTFVDWKALFRRNIEVVTKFPFVGVWAPKIDWVGWKIETHTIMPINKDLVAVGRTDGIVFYLSPRIIKRMRHANYSKNVFGRGIEVMFVLAAYMRGMIAVIDKSIEVKHPQASGYSEKEAHVQFTEFLKQLDIREEIQRRLIIAARKEKGWRPHIPT